MIVLVFNDGKKYIGNTYREALDSINKSNPVGAKVYTMWLWGFAKRVKLIRGHYPSLWSAKAFCESLLKLGVLKDIIET